LWRPVLSRLALVGVVTVAPFLLAHAVAGWWWDLWSMAPLTAGGVGAFFLLLWGVLAYVVAV
jgi:hypothetical protein